MQTLTDRLADATDLLIDFATLGEYGFEPVATKSGAPPCQARRRSRTPRSTGSWAAAIDRFATHR